MLRVRLGVLGVLLLVCVWVHMHLWVAAVSVSIVDGHHAVEEGYLAAVLELLLLLLLHALLSLFAVCSSSDACLADVLLHRGADGAADIL